MTAEVITAADGRTEAKFTRPQEADRFVDFEHPLFTRLQRPQGFSDRMIVEELSGFADGFNSGLSELVAAIDKAEKQTEELKPEFRSEKIGKEIVEPIARLQRVASHKVGEAAGSVESAQERLLSSIQRPRSEDQIAELRTDLQLSEIRGDLKAMPEGKRMAAALRAAKRCDLRRLWALDGAPMPLVNRDALREVQYRVAVERDPWRQELVAYREDVHRAAIELTAETYQFVRSSLKRLEDDHGLKAHVAPLEAFGG